MEQDELRRAGLKITTPRLKILEIFEHAAERHLSAEAVYQQLTQADEEVGLATIYRVLTQFTAAGLLHKHNFEGEHAVYELNQGDHHDHLVCTQCGRVEEFVDEVIEARQEAIAKQAKFHMTDHALTIFGLCQGCRG